MIRKWTMILLSLMLAMMIPLTAFAQREHALTIELGDMLAGEPAIDELLDVLVLKGTRGEKSAAFTVELDGTDVATLGLGVNAAGLYAYSSELLGDDVVCITWDDAFEFIKDLVATEMIDENGAGPGVNAIMEQIDEYKAQFLLALESGVQMNTGVVPKEEAMAQISETMGDYPEMIAWIEGVYDEMAAQNGEFTAEGRDAADQKYSLTIDNADFLALMKTDYVYSTIENQILSQDGTLDGDTLKQMTDQAIAEACASFEEMDVVVKTDVYTLDEGKTLVGIDMVQTFTVEAETDVQAQMALNYGRHTTEAGVSHKADFAMSEAGENFVEMKLDALNGANGVNKGIFGVLADGEEVVVQFGSELKADGSKERFASLYLRSGAAAILEPAASDRPIITFNVSSTDAKSEIVSMLDKASLETSLNIMRMTSEEMEAFVTDVSSRAMQTLFTAMGKLPASTLSLLMEDM